MELAHIYKGITSPIYPSASFHRVSSECLNLKRFCFLSQQLLKILPNTSPTHILYRLIKSKSGSFNSFAPKWTFQQCLYPSPCFTFYPSKWEFLLEREENCEFLSEREENCKHQWLKWAQIPDTCGFLAFYCLTHKPSPLLELWISPPITLILKHYPEGSSWCSVITKISHSIGSHLTPSSHMLLPEYHFSFAK